MGGDIAIYFDDQSTQDYQPYDLEEESIVTLVQKIDKEDSFLNITKWIDAGKHLLKDFPSGFIDDFNSIGRLAE